MAILRFFEGIRNPFLDAFFSVVTKFGEETLFILLGLLFFWCINKKQGYYILFIGFLGTVINQFLKLWFRIPRPWVKDPQFTIVESAREAASGYSFPSGHTQCSVGLYGGIARITNNKTLRVVMIVLSALIALSRMYLGVHTPADVLVSVAIATALIFIAYPIFKEAQKSPKVMYAVLFFFLAVIIAYNCFVVFNGNALVGQTLEEAANYSSAVENGFTLLGCALGLICIYFLDSKWIHFETKAVWWAQIIKVLGGLALVLLAKEGLKVPLDMIFENQLLSRTIRYFIMVIVGGALWPMTFRFFSKLGNKKA
jgi:undecaprenyl-diphosphatase